ncbi:phenol hydroxylase [Thioclava atlantica]|uniref:Phenol hydroxylase n=1 Tax=Thioclava atlantica TaxID=1317124 RepID=A0A085TU41_9RHOB|nr:phenol hydroxylase [Thioclava atlantica]
MLGAHSEAHRPVGRLNRSDRDLAEIHLPVADLGGEDIHRGASDELRGEDRHRALIDFEGRPDLLGHPAVHHDHPVGHRHRLDLIVGHIKRGDPELALQFADLDAHLHPQLGIEVRKRLVEQEHRRFAHDRAPHRDPLALAARELARFAVEIVGKLQQRRGLLDAAVDLVLRHARDLEPVPHVLAHRHMRVERIILEHHRDVAIHRFEFVHPFLADADLALAHAFEPRDHAQERRFPAARGAHDDDELAIADIHRDAVQHIGRAEAFLDLVELYGSHWSPLFLAVHEAADEEFLHRDHHDHRRDHRKDRRGHDDRPVGDVVPAGEHLLEAHDDGVHLGFGGDQERPEILVPAIDEEDHEERGDIGPAHREKDVDEEAHRARAIDARGLGQLVGNGEEELPEQEGRRRRGDERQDQARIGVQKPEARDDLIGRHDPHLDRQHQGQEDHPEEELPPGKPEIDDGEGREERDRDLPERDPERHHQRVQQHRRDRNIHAGKQRALVILDQVAARQDRHRRLRDLGLGVGRGDEGQPDREEDHKHARDHQRMGQPKRASALLDHAGGRFFADIGHQ